MPTSFVFNGAALALAWFAALNVAASLAVAAAVGRPDGVPSIAARAPLALRLLPAALSFGFVLLFFAPSYWKFEPRRAGEDFDVTVAAFALGGTVIAVAAAVRAFTASRRTARNVGVWSTTAEPIVFEGVDLPAFRLESAQPAIALAGIVRPRLLLTRGLSDALAPEELAASIAHEAEHARAHDNFKRLVMRAAPDLLAFLPAGRVLEHAWASASEIAADRAAARDARTRVALAGALVAIARTLPAADRELISPLAGGQLAARVALLLGDDPPAAPARPLDAWCRVAAVSAAVLAVAAVWTPLLPLVHRASELLAHGLP